jgi:hypothetical protein
LIDFLKTDLTNQSAVVKTYSWTYFTQQTNSDTSTLSTSSCFVPFPSRLRPSTITDDDDDDDDDYDDDDDNDDNDDRDGIKIFKELARLASNSKFLLAKLEKNSPKSCLC